MQCIDIGCRLPSVICFGDGDGEGYSLDGQNDLRLQFSTAPEDFIQSTHRQHASYKNPTGDG